MAERSRRERVGSRPAASPCIVERPLDHSEPRRRSLVAANRGLGLIVAAGVSQGHRSLVAFGYGQRLVIWLLAR